MLQTTEFHLDNMYIHSYIDIPLQDLINFFTHPISVTKIRNVELIYKLHNIGIMCINIV